MVNIVDETGRDEPSHLDLKCLQGYLCWFAGMRGLIDARKTVITLVLGIGQNFIIDHRFCKTD